MGRNISWKLLKNTFYWAQIALQLVISRLNEHISQSFVILTKEKKEQPWNSLGQLGTFAGCNGRGRLSGGRDCRKSCCQNGAY